MLLAARDDGHGLSDAEIQDNVVIFFFAGFDTTAATLAWAFHLLAKHPDIRERLQTETDTVP